MSRDAARKGKLHVACQDWNAVSSSWSAGLLRTAFCSAVVTGVGVIVVEEERT
jgi:hypothetical protein